VKPLPLRSSLTLFYTGMLALLLSGAAVAYHRVVVSQLDSETTAMLEDVARGLHGYLKFGDGRPRLEYNHTDPEAVTFIEEGTRYYQIYGVASDTLLVQSPAMESLGLHYTPAEIAAIRGDPRVYDVQTDRGRLRLVNSLITSASGEAYLLQVGEPLDRMDRAVRQFDRLLIWQLAAGLPIAALVGYFMAGRALRPMARLASAAHNVSLTNLSERLPIRGAGDELDDLAGAFNQALARVEAGVGEMRQFSAALAHELRTPLAILRGEMELALTGTLSPAEARQKLAVQLEELDHLTRLINQILTLARAESGQIPLVKEPVDLSRLLAVVGEQMEAMADARDVRLTVTAPPAVLVRGDAGWLQRLVLILLDNGIQFTNAGGSVNAVLSLADGAAVLDVADTGIGIAAEALPHVFDRFYQADPSRSRRAEGAGLGLTLAKWIALNHGGSISAASRPGEGSTFTVRLPITAPVPPPAAG
jgi:heavy metal sensor kinase